MYGMTNGRASIVSSLPRQANFTL